MILQNNVPRLRFKDENGNNYPDWKNFLLKTIAIKTTNKNKDNEYDLVLTNSARCGIINQIDFFDRNIVNKSNLKGDRVVKVDDVVYNPRISSNAPVGPINRNKLNIGIVSPLYFVFRFKKGSKKFFEIYYQSTHWHIYMKSVANYGARSDRLNISKNNFLLMPIPFPSIDEQQKIASFLSSVDSKIEKLTRKKELLEEYKKGVMQKLFSQEIRFKDDDGNDYPDWADKRLGDIFIFKQGVQCSLNNQFSEKSDGLVRFIRIVDLTKNNKPVRYINDPGTNHHLVKNDIFMVRYGSAGMVAIGFEGVIANNLFRLIPKKPDTTHNNFYFYLLKRMQSKLEALTSSTTMSALNFSSLKQFRLFMPSLSEQHKIADFLTSIDTKIEPVASQIDKTKNFKKGLLQQMFV